MTDTFLIRRCIGIVLAVLLVIGLGWFGCDSLLKADEYVPVNEVVLEEADEVLGAAAEEASTTVRTVTLTLSQDAPAEGADALPGAFSATGAETVINDTEVPRAALTSQGPNRYLMLALVFVPVIVGAGIWGVREQKKKKASFYSFTAL